MITRIKSSKGQYLKKRRQATVEPVLGTLLNFMGMRKVNTRGLALAHKNFVLAAACYNLKKYLNFSKKRLIAQVNALEEKLLATVNLSSFSGSEVKKLPISTEFTKRENL